MTMITTTSPIMRIILDKVILKTGPLNIFFSSIKNFVRYGLIVNPVLRMAEIFCKVFCITSKTTHTVTKTKTTLTKGSDSTKAYIKSFQYVAATEKSLPMSEKYRGNPDKANCSRAY